MQKNFILKPGYPITTTNREDPTKTDVQRCECFALARALKFCNQKAIIVCTDVQQDMVSVDAVYCINQSGISQYATKDSILYVVCSRMTDDALSELDRGIIEAWQGTIIWCYWDLRLIPQIADMTFDCKHLYIATQATNLEVIRQLLNDKQNLDAHPNIDKITLKNVPFHALPMWYKQVPIDETLAANIKSYAEIDKKTPLLAFPIVRFDEFDKQRQQLVWRALHGVGFDLCICGNANGLDLDAANAPLFAPVKTESIIDWYSKFHYGLVLQDQISYDAGAIMFRTTEIAMAGIPAICVNALSWFGESELAHCESIADAEQILKNTNIFVYSTEIATYQSTVLEELKATFIYLMSDLSKPKSKKHYAVVMFDSEWELGIPPERRDVIVYRSTRYYGNDGFAAIESYANTPCQHSQYVEANSKQELEKKIDEIKANFNNSDWVKSYLEKL